MKKLLLVLSLAFLPVSVTQASNTDQPYAGLQARAIKALSPERVNGLLEGQGLSYALAAELNGLPGPRHVLDLAERLGLNEAQESDIEAIFSRMNASARELGAQLVEAEAALDSAFAARQASAAEVAALTARIAEIEGKLRAVHLTAHLEADPLLSAHQKHLYSVERGYAAEGAGGHGHGGHGG